MKNMAAWLSGMLTSHKPEKEVCEMLAVVLHFAILLLSILFRLASSGRAIPILALRAICRLSTPRLAKLLKGTDFSLASQDDISSFVHCLNLRPRKRLAWLSPFEVFFDCLLHLA